jgi:uncharacterized membrane protein YbhN (UPF0104 family)
MTSAPSETSRERGRLGRGDDQPHVPAGWRVALGVAATLLVALGVVVLIAKAAGFSRVREATEDADSSWFLVCFVAEVVSFGAYAVVVREALRWHGGPTTSFGLSLHVTLASLGATRIVAAAGAGGLAVTYWCFRRARMSFEEAFVRVLGLNTLVYLVFGVGAWVAALIATLHFLGSAPLGLTLPWLVVIPICLVAARYVTEPARVARLTEAAGGVLRKGLAYAISGAAWVRALLGERRGRRSLCASAVYWGGDVVCLWAALHSVGESLPVSELVLAYATGYVAMVLPLPFAGVGGVDAAMTFALTAVGIPLAPALVAVAVYRLFGFWVPTIPALAALVLLPRAGRGLEAAAAAAP